MLPSVTSSHTITEPLKEDREQAAEAWLVQLSRKYKPTSSCEESKAPRAHSLGGGRRKGREYHQTKAERGKTSYHDELQEWDEQIHTCIYK